MADRQQTSTQRWEYAFLIGIFAVAAVLRMGWPGSVEFKRDEALLLQRALDVATGQQFHLRGISSSVGFPNTAVSVWLYALPLLLWKHVYAGILFTGLVNSLAVAGCWWFARRYWGTVAGISAALLYATAPWAIFHSQKIWAQNLLAPLVILWAVAAGLAFVERKKWAVVLHLLSLALAIQLHYSALALAPATILFILVFRRRVAWRVVALGILVALITAIPFLIYLISEAGAALPPISEASSGLATGFDLSAWRNFWLLTTGREIHALAGPAAFRDFLASVPDLTLVHLFWIILVIGGVVLLGRRIVRNLRFDDSSAEAGFIVLGWLLAPILAFSIPWLPVELHYLLSVYPSQFIVAGVAFSLLVVYVGKWRPVAWGAFFLSTAAQVWIWLALMGFIGSQATPGGYGTPVRYHLQAVEQSKKMLFSVSASEILIAGRSEDRNQDEFAAVYDVLLRGIPRRLVNVDRSALFPAEPVVAIIANQLDSPGFHSYLVAAREVRKVPLRSGEGSLRVLQLAADGGPEPGIELDPHLLFANWVNLIGYDLPAPQGGGKRSWRIYWHPGANPDPADYHFFNHLIDASGQLLGQQDAPLFSPGQWHAGDTIISFFELPWQDEPGRAMKIRTGIYTYPALDNVPLLDVAGIPSSDAAELPLTVPGS